MMVRLSLSSLRDVQWHEYLIRFALGGLATVATGLVSRAFGPSIGGLFLALPAIFCASATLIEKHESARKQKAGLQGRRRGREAAALDAAGAALGSVGMLAFAACFYLLIETSEPGAFVTASLVWLLVSAGFWWARRHVRITRRERRARRN
jgi:hypothetical protein